jgi:hypothetical protein
MSNVSIGKKAVRKMALLLLDDDNGISIEAYGFLSGMLVETGNDDILEAVDVTEQRAYIGEDYAEEELDKLKEDYVEGGNCHSVFNFETGELELKVDEDEQGTDTTDS